MNAMKTSRSGEAGFTLIEMLIATALFLLVVAALATVTSQWLPNWNYGMARIQRAEQVSLAMERILADFAAAEFIPPNAKIKQPLFDGGELAATFVRTSIGPNSAPGLEIVRLLETADEKGPILVRSSAPFVPIDSSAVAQLKFTDPVVLLRAPFRVQFSYAGNDRAWRSIWREAEELPAAVRITVRNSATGQTLAVSAAATIHVNAGVQCATQPKACFPSAVQQITEPAAGNETPNAAGSEMH
jgi:general secretion pathway protein J